MNGITNIANLYKAVTEEIIYDITIENDIIYEDNTNIKISIINFDETARYKIVVNINDEQILEENIKEKEDLLNLQLVEGSNDIKIALYKNEEEKLILNKTIYYIEPYKRQFLDELSNNGVSTHFGHHTYIDDVDLSIDLLKALGVKYIRDDIRWEIVNKDGYTILDHWINRIHDSGIKILGILGFPDKNSLGNDYRISNENELKKYNSYVEEIAKRYKFIESYEIWNEPNSAWTKEEDFYWYARMSKDTHNIVKSINNKANIIIGSAMTPEKDTNNGITAQRFFTSIFNTNIYNNAKDISYHQYDKSYTRKYMKNMQKSIENTINSNGGFMRTNITENGLKTNQSNREEKERAEEIIKQSITEDIISNMYIYYCWRDMEEEESYLNYGLINYNYTPKLSYYAMKNFFENTNGAEYIGNLDLAEELEAHVYDKDGKPVIIAWSNNSSKNIEINYKNFTAKDIYGKEIKANENGKLVITTSPVYIYNLDYKYYYKAISKVATEKYQEFEEKFAEQISKMPNVQNKITQMKTYMQNVGKAESKILETSSIKAMKMHYEIGNAILEAYNNKQIEVEPVKISSMLDALDDIGNSYEDLVTVTAQTREPKLEQTKLKIKNAEEKINKNSEIEIIYPNKILEFSKDYYEKAEYINNLEEENDIKTGLIMSKILHSELLANWSDIFSQIQIDKYIDQYISDNPITINYSTTEITNKNVTVTLETTAKIEITNNSNSKKYTFEENGSFTYEYKIKGRALKITATVNNIDKESPKILGVTDGKVYTEPVTPQITDKNLQEIKLTFNGEIIEEYESNIKLQDEGYYVITAKDKAGNETKTEFQILTNQNKDYQIQGTTINNISASTNKKDFEEKLGIETQYTVTRNGKEIKENEAIATGDVLTTKSGDNYTLIVTGDVNRDGKITIHDIIKLRIHLVYENNLDKIEQLAADCNLDGKKLGISDLIRMRIIATMQIDSK